MATRREKVEAGLFLLLGTTLVFAVLFVLIGLSLAEKANSYFVYFEESIGNLKTKSPVSFKGVPVGDVGDIRLSPDQTEIIVELRIDEDARITEHVMAQLKYNPLTQIYFVELLLEEKGGAIVPPGGRIPPKPSNLDRIISSLPEMQANLTGLLERLNMLFSDDNLQEFSSILDGVDAVTASAPEKLDRLESEALDLKQDLETALERVIARLEETAAHVDRFAMAAGELVATTDRSLSALLNEMEAATVEWHELVSALLQHPTNAIWPDPERVNAVLRELEAAAREARILLRQTQKEPSRLIWPENVPERETPD